MTESPQQVDASLNRKPPSLVDMIDQPRFGTAQRLWSASVFIKVGVIASLLVVMNWWQLRYLLMKWYSDQNWSHGFVIPLFSLYLIYARRDELFAAERRVCIWALPFVFLSIVLIVIGFHPIGTPWVCEVGMIGLLFSLVWYLAGPGVLRVTWLPILFLAFAMPIPDMAYNRIAYPLQNLAAKFSTMTLQLVGVSMRVTASRMFVDDIHGNTHELVVAEACSGVRSLMAYLALGVAWAYLEERPIWQRVILVLAAAPIAILCNMIRVTITCTMHVIDRPELGKDFMHTFAGLAMLIPAVLMFWGLGKLLECLLVEEEEPSEASQESGASAEDLQT